MQGEHEPREGEPDDLEQADPIADIIEKLTGGNKQSKILDVGAGTGLSGARVRIIQSYIPKRDTLKQVLPAGNLCTLNPYVTGTWIRKNCIKLQAGGY